MAAAAALWALRRASSATAPAAGKAWSRNGTRREPRRLKHRAVDDVRIVPCPPELTALLRAHRSEHGTSHDGRLFRGARGGPLWESVYGHTWGLARAAALSRRGRFPTRPSAV